MADNIADILKVEGINAKGFGTIPKLVMKDRRITPEAKSIYAYFKSYAGAGTTAFPKSETIQYDLCMGKSRYYKHYNLLCEFGYLKVDQVKSNKGKFSHNVYTLIEKPSTQNEYTDKKTENGDTQPSTQIGYTGNEYTEIQNTENEDIIINKSFKNNNIKNDDEEGSFNFATYIVDQADKNKLDADDIDILITNFTEARARKIKQDGECINPTGLFNVVLKNYIANKQTHKVFEQLTTISIFDEETSKNIERKALDEFIDK